MKGFLPLSLATTAVLGLLHLASAAFAAEVKIEETIAGPANAGGLYVVSQDEAHIAYVGAKGTRTVVSVDGVEGPVLDELFNGSAAVIAGGGQVLVHNANAGGKFNGTPSAVIFSQTGGHHAYIGRQGNDYVVVHDGKEIGRGLRSALNLNMSPLGLSPGGRNVFWGEMKIEGSHGVHRMFVNGRPDPWASAQEVKLVFSPDETRYAYAAGSAEDSRKPLLIVDGKLASYSGESPLFTADSKNLITTTEAKNVLIDGKRAPVEGLTIEKIVPAPVGNRVGVIMRKKNVNNQGVGTLYLDNKEVPGTEGAADLTFSSDGKHWALRCVNVEAGSAFMVIDGKKMNEYQTVSDKVCWTADFSKAIYTVTSSGRNFVVVGTEEFAVGNLSSLTRSPFVFPKKGGRYAFSSGDPSNRNSLAIVDGKQVLPPDVYAFSDSVEFSENGARYAFVLGTIGRQGTAGFIDNGTVNDARPPVQFLKMGSDTAPFFLLSPDGKHLARVAYTDQKIQGLYVNEKLVYPTAMGGIAYPSFTADSKHLFWLATERVAGATNKFEHVVYVDGLPAARLDRELVIGTKGAWHMDARGVVTCLGVNGGSVKRYRLTASPDTDVEKMILNAEEAQAKAVADAAAAKKKADDEALAAKQKTEADAAAAAAKRKADSDAAIAAKAKARQDAADAKAKARADAAAAKAAKQQK